MNFAWINFRDFSVNLRNLRTFINANFYPRKVIKNGSLNSSVTYFFSKDINRVIAHKLAAVLQPCFQDDDAHRTVNTLNDLLGAIATHPAYKFAAIKSIPHISDNSMAFTTFVWPALMKHLRQMLIADAAMEEGICTSLCYRNN